MTIAHPHVRGASASATSQQVTKNLLHSRHFMAKGRAQADAEFDDSNSVRGCLGRWDAANLLLRMS
ncbi:MAG: hypothetical protein JWN85_1114 [Gammaproteobacteria bacterium]|nr:hypothetical protein [Gammaproteobacteria bacterium]